MNRKQLKNIAFSQGGSAAFLVMSPLQLMCAINAITAFDIKDYLVVIALEKSETSRHKQMYTIAKQFNVEYISIYLETESETNKHRFVERYAKEEGHKKVDRIFIGDYLNRNLLVLAARYVKNDSVILFMDDGTTTLSCLKGIDTLSVSRTWGSQIAWFMHGKRAYMNEFELIRNELLKYGGIVSKCYYTIYGNVKTRFFDTYTNDLGVLRIFAKQNNTQSKYVCVAGTAIDRYPELWNISEEAFESILWYELRKIRDTYPNEHIIYVPHGRERDEYIPAFCKVLDIEYKKIDVTLEQFILQYEEQLIELYGFRSAVLTTVKMMLPEVNVINIEIIKKQNAPYWEKAKIMDNYFEQMGIIPEKIIYPSPTKEQRIASLKSNLESIIHKVLKKIRI